MCANYIVMIIVVHNIHNKFTLLHPTKGLSKFVPNSVPPLHIPRMTFTRDMQVCNSLLQIVSILYLGILINTHTVLHIDYGIDDEETKSCTIFYSNKSGAKHKDVCRDFELVH